MENAAPSGNSDPLHVPIPQLSDGESGFMNRWPQVVLIGSLLLGSWLGMQAVHELGHVVGAWMTGGRVARVVLDPRTISRTDLAENPNPLFVVWAGPVIGVALPLLVWRVAVATRLPGAFVLQFFAGFCLIANGLYIGIGSFGAIGDCGEMLQHGATVWQLWLFGAAAAPLGIRLWNGQGPHFGFGPAQGRVSRGAVHGCLAACVALLMLGFAVGRG
jgi:hypothetical protein